ncbi:protease-4 [Paucidesulfovibrio gracilis DSM 16080]|uniref:Protease-4 n=1 Tax=Paucidesulfovibrio gracilis DSM 16080 TaxID=1121449 RepID=A0A1T4Y4D3_9BACT|nr:signal peptide peptidase SppA [Paucidesulfovibrio gracilis]SKA96596.1 protease-4 [Paucidesulfovibrio gracilis DSM 16080]
MKPKAQFSARHPFLFGFALLILAVVLFMGASAFFGGRHLGGAGSSGRTVGVVYLEGMILDGADVVAFLRELREDPDVEGVLLRVNSPGGAVAPSQEMFQAVRELAAVKPVVASYGSVAASGGYYASCPATLIVANPGSVTGSIGVLMEYMDMSELAGELGVRRVLLASGKNKGAGSPLEPLTPQQREQLMGIVRDMHDQFVSDVTIARSMRKDVVAALADGRVYTGRQARENGLVDELGGFEYALSRLMDLCHMTERPDLYEGPPRDVPLLEKLVGAESAARLFTSWTQRLVPGVRFLYQ